MLTLPPELEVTVLDKLITPPPGWEIVSGEPHAESTGKIAVINRSLKREYDIYKKLPQHPHLLQLLPGSTPERLVLPYLSGGTLRRRLDNKKGNEADDGCVELLPLSPAQRLQLAADAAEALAVLHTIAVVHCDVQLSNLMLGEDHRLYLIDFAGSRLGDEEGTALENVRFYRPRPLDEPSIVRNDVFALGSVLYAIFTGKEPYADKTDEDVTDLYTAGVFPSLDGVTCGEVTAQCWKSPVYSAEEAFGAISSAA